MIVNLDPTEPELGRIKVPLKSMHNGEGCECHGAESNGVPELNINHYLGSVGDYMDRTVRYWEVGRVRAGLSCLCLFWPSASRQVGMPPTQVFSAERQDVLGALQYGVGRCWRCCDNPIGFLILLLPVQLVRSRDFRFVRAVFVLAVLVDSSTRAVRLDRHRRCSTGVVWCGDACLL